MYTKFNHVNSLSLIARAHQLVQEGYKYMFDEALATVWSAPNYCYRCGNMAAILTIREDGTRGFTVYGPAEENERDVAQQRTRRVVRCIFIQRSRWSVLTWGLSKGQYAVFCVDQSRRHIDFTVLTILSRPSVPPLYTKLWQPCHLLPHLSSQSLRPYGLSSGDVTHER